MSANIGELSERLRPRRSGPRDRGRDRSQKTSRGLRAQPEATARRNISTTRSARRSSTRSRSCPNTISPAPRPRSSPSGAGRSSRVLDGRSTSSNSAAAARPRRACSSVKRCACRGPLRYSPDRYLHRGAATPSSLALVEAYPALPFRAYAGRLLRRARIAAIDVRTRVASARRCSWARTSATTSPPTRRRC